MRCVLYRVERGSERQGGLAVSYLHVRIEDGDEVDVDWTARAFAPRELRTARQRRETALAIASEEARLHSSSSLDVRTVMVREVGVRCARLKMAAQIAVGLLLLTAAVLIAVHLVVGCAAPTEQALAHRGSWSTPASWTRSELAAHALTAKGSPEMSLIFDRCRELRIREAIPKALKYAYRGRPDDTRPVTEAARRLVRSFTLEDLEAACLEFEAPWHTYRAIATRIHHHGEAQ